MKLSSRDIERFWRFVDRSGGETACWPWLGHITRGGYGQFRLNGTAVFAHHVACAIAGKAVPIRHVRDHLCRNRACVNAAHIEIVTFRENVLRGVGACASNARKTVCLRGHEYTAENTIAVAHGRECRQCRETRERGRPKRDRRAYRKAYYHSHKAGSKG